MGKTIFVYFNLDNVRNEITRVGTWTSTVINGSVLFGCMLYTYFDRNFGEYDVCHKTAQ